MADIYGVSFDDGDFSTYNDVSILKEGNPVMCIISYAFFLPHLNMF